MLEQWGIALMSSWASYIVRIENKIRACERDGPSRVSPFPCNERQFYVRKLTFSNIFSLNFFDSSSAFTALERKLKYRISEFIRFLPLY
jgi:hypothetical protein